MLNWQPPPEPETFCEGPDRANVFFCPLTWAKLIFFYPSQHGPSNFFSCPPDRTKLIFICAQPNPSYNFFAHPFPPPAGQNFPKFYSCSIASNEFVTNKKSDDNFAWKVKEQKFLKGLPFLLTLLPPPPFLELISVFSDGVGDLRLSEWFYGWKYKYKFTSGNQWSQRKPKENLRTN